MKKTFAKAIALTAAFSLITVNAAFAGGSIGHGDISVLDDQGQVAIKLSGQNPIEDESLLACDGKCMLKSQGISIIAADKSKMAVKNETDTFNLYVKEGRVDYIINSNARKIRFFTPSGSYTIAEAIFNASTGSSVKGSVVITDEGQTEIYVSEGRLVFTTDKGPQTVDANNKIIFAQDQDNQGGGQGGGDAGAAAAAGGFTFLGLGGGGAIAALIGVVAAAGLATYGIVQATKDDDDASP